MKKAMGINYPLFVLWAATRMLDEKGHSWIGLKELMDGMRKEGLIEYLYRRAAELTDGQFIQGSILGLLREKEKGIWGEHQSFFEEQIDAVMGDYSGPEENGLTCLIASVGQMLQMEGELDGKWKYVNDTGHHEKRKYNLEREQDCLTEREYGGEIKDTDIVWKYMDIQKLEDIVNRRRLYMRPFWRTNDVAEGEVPWGNRWQLQIASENTAAKTGGGKSFHDSIREENERKKLMWVMSSWTVKEVEDVGMWNSYTTTGSGVAIKTRYCAVKRAIRAWPENMGKGIVIGKVKYIDIGRERMQDYDIWGKGQVEVDTLMPLFHKRKEFSGERELRIAREIDPDREPEMTEVEMTEGRCRQRATHGYIWEDPGELIEEVVLGPETEEWIANSIRSMDWDGRVPPRIAKSVVGKR